MIKEICKCLITTKEELLETLEIYDNTIEPIKCKALLVEKLNREIEKLRRANEDTNDIDILIAIVRTKEKIKKLKTIISKINLLKKDM